MANNWENIRQDVLKAGGIKCVKMAQLRDASPYRRLGPGVNDEISTALRQVGIEHWPKALPVSADEAVYVYATADHAVAELIGALANGPSEHGASAILKATRPSNENPAAQKLNELRALYVQLGDILRDDEESASEAA